MQKLSFLFILIYSNIILAQANVQVYELPGAAFNDVSVDGNYVCGVLNFSQAFVWSASTGIINLTPDNNGEAFAVSNTGRVVGRRPDSNWVTPGGDVVVVPGYWEIDGSWHPIGNFPGIEPFDPYFFGNATGISADGTIIGGYGAHPNWHPEAFLWTETDSFYRTMGDNQYQGTRALSLSADGQVLGGWISGPGIYWHPTIWNPDSLELGSFNPNFNDGDVYALNSDGTMAFGKAGGTNWHIPMYWTDSTGLVNLLDINSNVPGVAFGGADDGSIIGLQVGPFGYEAGYIWTPNEGLKTFNDWLADKGVNLGSNWSIRQVADISADGRVVIAWGDNSNTPDWSDGIVVVLDNPVSVDPNSIPTGYLLSQNYPNPFNPSTTIQFKIPEGGLVNLTVYNLLGERITTLVSEFMSAGEHKINFNAVNLPSGVYLVRMSSGNFSNVIKMNLLK